MLMDKPNITQAPLCHVVMQNISALLPWYDMVSMLHSEHEIHKSNLNEYQQQQ